MQDRRKIARDDKKFAMQFRSHGMGLLTVQYGGLWSRRSDSQTGR
jgi:hypothetical protein